MPLNCWLLHDPEELAYPDLTDWECQEARSIVSQRPTKKGIPDFQIGGKECGRLLRFLFKSEAVILLDLDAQQLIKFDAT